MDMAAEADIPHASDESQSQAVESDDREEGELSSDEREEETRIDHDQNNHKSTANAKFRQYDGNFDPLGHSRQLGMRGNYSQFLFRRYALR